MSSIGWSYALSNMNTDGSAVAMFRNKAGNIVFYVYEQKDCYYAKSELDFIKSVTVTYEEAALIEGVSEHGNVDDVLLRRLKHACDIIAERYDNQVYNILHKLGMN